MNRISPDLLYDTLNLVQLARETALARGNKAQAERLAPVAENLRDLVGTARQSQAPAAGSGQMAQPDFRTLLNAIQTTPAANTTPTTSGLERNQIISAMSEAGMAEIDIARQMGITREEVRLIASLGKTNRFAYTEVIK